ncbi:hypothetical protein DITRI_Ditri02bG0097900 [Diplodiscus trichospermus]
MAKVEGLGLEITELRLGLPGAAADYGHHGNDKNDKKRVFSEISEEDGNGKMINNGLKMQNKTQVVGWPPVCSYRKKNSFSDKDGSKTSKMYVKVSMDGAPFLRKIDLGMHKGYSDLVQALEKLFGEALRDADSCEFVPIYEDKDGDWMLAGDVPWEMFIESCKRLRIMKRADAKGFEVLRSREALNGTLNKEN